MAIDTQQLRELYPFEGRYLDLGGCRMHFLDEGPRDGLPVVMVHGNPSWSFLFRDLVKAWRPHGRAIVPDHVGMGLSDKPDDGRYPYTLRRRVDDLEALLDHLGMTGPVCLVLHDWGGMIGMAWAARHPERVARIVALNTAAFRLPASKAFPWPLRLVRDTPLGAGLVRGLNAFAEVASRVCVVRPLAPEVRAAFVAPYDTWAHRVATLRFVEDIPLGPDDPAWSTVVEVEQALPGLAHVPVLLGWGARDFVFDDHFLAAWQARFPEAVTFRHADAGHYVLEDAGETLIPEIVRFLAAAEVSQAGLPS
ncbi:MAG: alpha/beta fold hydrolase [Candidatus Sericytochromatia bacterium]|nr:alpha/beta fold hydrolase [Candidatus Sericytochromatia bacterium]